MFDNGYRLYPPDVNCDLVTLVSFPRDLRHDYEGVSHGTWGGFPIALFSTSRGFLEKHGYLHQISLGSMGTCIRHVCYQ
jgi:hypothetical protein